MRRSPRRTESSLPEYVPGEEHETPESFQAYYKRVVEPYFEIIKKNLEKLTKEQKKNFIK